MRLAYRFNIRRSNDLYRLCVISKNLYNQALYTVKNELRVNNKWLFYKDLNRIMQSVTNLDGQVNYRLLKAQVAQQCLMLLDKNIKSYIKSIKRYSKDKCGYNGCPRMPKYKKDMNLLVYPNQCCTIKDGYIHLSKELKIRIPQYDEYKERLQKFNQVRILPMFNKSFIIEIVYTVENEINNTLDSNAYASVDLGVNNLATLVMPNEHPMLFNGRILKSKNQYFNKAISDLKTKLTNGQRTSKRIRGLWLRRDNLMRDIFHKISRTMVDEMIRHSIGNIVVGYNKGWKDSINFNKKNSQTFVYIPYEKLIGYLKYKCEMAGIRFILNEESYTSKCDALALEPICKHEKYQGRRIKRGLFKSSIGKIINADVNGALNIMRKVVGNSEIVSRIVDSGRLFRPIRVNMFEHIKTYE